ncbi:MULTISPECIES: acetate--CoA ligase family protein [unclassified Leisingera]|uniref:acetate--CoA ligase family protein n=1 Tax=unclassified Leisingera TaxID=2614906 RepID=UPI0002F5E28B|nr:MULTISPECIES: acetate--CoA ligase family protein [unclassified Leisingera]KIC24411.1 acyl-CoA synthetase [Leisingera sp. ANG-S3]KIC53127.1 acyl-CoA synthetase [Leisingera sp. ANG-S]KID07177.1 acyl-CoA synthetase [Leisingera sp. ANG1]
MQSLNRLFRPKTIAVIGGGAWCRLVIEQCQKMGFEGTIWPVHPKAEEVAGLPAFKDADSLPEAPDAAFIGVNRFATIEVVRALSARGAGGAVCFASGFLEAAAEDAEGADLQAQLLEAAGGMPFLGPNCYGFINYLDGALLWPDQHGGQRAEKGVALVTQSSNIAINLTMQKRGLPLAYVVTAGNQAQSGIAAIGEALLEDDRVTALGLHIEGFGDLRAFEALAARARELGKPVIALKVGKSAEAQAATVSHTASLAGGDAGAGALLSRLGIPRLDDLPSFLETLKLLHVAGRLPSNRIATISCSGGEASLAADTGHARKVEFPPLNDRQKTDLRAALGPMVALANPLDYHTYIWRDTEAMTKAFSAMMDPQLAMTMLVVDFPRDDRCDASDWECTIQAAIGSRERTGANVGLVATLPELLPEEVAARLMDAGVVPFCGLSEAIAACEAASLPLPEAPAPLLLPTPVVEPDLVPEAEAKWQLSSYGLRTPRSKRAASATNARAVAVDVGFPVVLKGEGVAHKTEAGAVALNLNSGQEVSDAAFNMPAERFLVEEMVTGAVAELLIGVVKDPAHGFVMTLAAGGTLTELMEDSASFLLPASDAEIEAALKSLRVSKLLDGYRGAPAADREAILRAIRAVEAYVMENALGLEEIEINPLLCTPKDAVAADALMRRKY